MKSLRQPPVTFLPVTASLGLRESGEGVLNKDGTECRPHSRLYGSLRVGPFQLHCEAYEVVGVEDGCGYRLEAMDDAWEDELEACFAALNEGCPECHQINGRWYLLRAFPFAE